MPFYVKLFFSFVFLCGIIMILFIIFDIILNIYLSYSLIMALLLVYIFMFIFIRQFYQDKIILTNQNIIVKKRDFIRFNKSTNINLNYNDINNYYLDNDRFSIKIKNDKIISFKYILNVNQFNESEKEIISNYMKLKNITKSDYYF